jgi:hypothetical protein
VTTTQWAAAGADRLDRENPWPGLASYEESAHDFFSGRAEEADDLQRRIVSDPVTVLFGKSGLGKTSLLKAGVFPRLREKGLLPILLRLQVQPDAAPFVEQVGLALFDELRSAKIEHPDAGQAETLWEYLHRTRQEFWTAQNRLVRPVLVFDQFEELFTLGRAMPAAVDRFREDLADLAENRIPDGLASRLGERAPAELGLDVQTMPYKIVVALREDFLADLEEWRLSMPSLRRNRMRLLPMRPDQALDAVFNVRTSHLVSEPIARTIVAFLSTGAAGEDGPSDAPGVSVEPALLSLFCRGVNEHRKRDHKTSFDEALVEGGKGTIVADFYRTSVGDQPERVRCFIEEELITEHGFRNSYAIESAIAKGSITNGELTTLINRHLLRHEHHLGTDRVELTHDLLTKAVADGRDERRKAERIRRERRQLQKTLGFAAACLVVTAVFGAMALLASSARDRARSRELAALAGSTLNQDPELAIALALEGLKHAETTEARSVLVNAAQYAWPSASLGVGQVGGNPIALALSSDGSQLVVLAAGGVLTLWDVTAAEPRPVWNDKVALRDATTLAFSPDRTLVAVARTASVDLLDAATGKTRATLPADLEQDRNRALVVFSPDNEWLGASLSQQRLQIWERRADRWTAVAPPPVPPGLSGFALLPGGTRIAAVAQPAAGGLAAYAIDRKDDGSWNKPAALDLSECMKPQSVSQGAAYFSATWNARACTYDATSNASRASVSNLVISDVVWSAQGQGFAELLPQERSLDLIVGRQQKDSRLESHIKGAHPNENTSEKSHLISVSDEGTRVAVIDDDNDKLVRIYALAHHKPFLSRLPTAAVVLAPDGSWIAAATAAQDRKSATIDVISIAQTFAPNQRARGSTRIALDRVPDRLYATADSVVATWQLSEYGVFDAASGKLRFERRPGYVQPIGPDGTLLLVNAAGDWRVIETRDGSTVGWQLESDRRGATPLLSPGGRAIALFRKRRAGHYDIALYAVRGRSVTPVGQILDMVGEPGLGTEIAEDGRSVIDRNSQKVWRISDARAVAEATDLPGAAPDGGSVSPAGRYEVRQEQEPASSGIRVVRRADKVVIRDFTVRGSRYSFSPDDRWLAVWGEDAQGLQLLDLSRNEILFHLDSAKDVATVTFFAGNILRVERGADVMLIPLDVSMMNRVGSWLARRQLTDQERCAYGLGGDECRVKTAPGPRAAPDAKGVAGAPRAQ